jgi:hypothetical protein
MYQHLQDMRDWDEVAVELRQFLSPEEVEATRRRLDSVLGDIGQRLAQDPTGAFFLDPP